MPTPTPEAFSLLKDASPFLGFEYSIMRESLFKHDELVGYASVFPPWLSEPSWLMPGWAFTCLAEVKTEAEVRETLRRRGGVSKGFDALFEAVKQVRTPDKLPVIVITGSNVFVTYLEVKKSDRLD